MTWSNLYPGCDVRFEDDRPFLLEWASSPLGLGRAIAELVNRGFRVTLVADDASESGCRGAFVTSCMPIRGKKSL